MASGVVMKPKFPLRVLFNDGDDGYLPMLKQLRVASNGLILTILKKKRLFWTNLIDLFV